MGNVYNVDLSVKLGGLELKNPVLLASGTVGYGNEISEFLDLNLIGGIVTKSISLKPRKGNPPQRIVETASGMLNAIGLANVGLDDFIKSKLPYLEKYDSKVIANIAASSVDEYVECAARLSEEKRVDALEINVSCPNVKDGGLEFGNNIDAVKFITSEVKKVATKPFLIKLSPNVPNIADFAIAAKEAGADGVSAINTFVGTAFDINTRKPKIFNITGGLSGPAIKPLALAKVFMIRRRSDVPIIGIGGIMNWKDVIEFFIAGASAIQIGTVNFIQPDAAVQIIKGITDYCSENNIKSIKELTGSYILNV